MNVSSFLISELDISSMQLEKEYFFAFRLNAKT